MTWKVRITPGRPQARIVWDNLLYRTKLTVNGQEVKPGTEVAVNITAEPLIRLTLVAENVGDGGLCWTFIGIRPPSGKIYPLFLKEDLLKTGDIIVGDVEYTVDYDFLKYYYRVVGTEHLVPEFDFVGYVGHGDVINALKPLGIRLPEAYVIDFDSGTVYSVDDLSSVTDYIQRIVLGGSRAFRIVSVRPIEIPELRVKLRASDAGYDFYSLYSLFEKYTVNGASLPFNVDFSVLSTAADDSTEGVL